MMKSPTATAAVREDHGLPSRAAGVSALVLLTLLAVLPISIVAEAPPGAASAPMDEIGTAAPGDSPVDGALPATPGELTVPAAPAAQAAPDHRAATAPLFTPADTGAAPRPTPAAFRSVRGLSRQALTMALDAVSCARSRGVAGRDDLLTLIDYSLPSTAPRLWVLDLARGKVLFHELVAHGAGSGDNYATRFSNLDNSRATSLGLFLTRDTYEGGNGYSLRLEGLDAGVNDRAFERKIVMHGAWYVSPDQIQRYGRLGRSWGCPALPAGVAHDVIDTVKGGSFLFAYAAGDSPRSAASHSCKPGGPSSAPATRVAAKAR
jgi:hypothetical protein